nr:putative acetyltransferase [Raoultella sp. NCTC 9187]
MPELLTPRLRCSPLQLDDWSFFLALQRDPQVMLYIADSRPLAEIREAFDSRLSPWTPGARHWLCLIVRDRQTHEPLGMTGYRHHEDDCAEVGFLFTPQAQGKGYGYESLQALVRFCLFRRRRPSPDRHRHRRQHRFEKPAAENRLSAGGRAARMLLAQRPLA